MKKETALDLLYIARRHPIKLEIDEGLFGEYEIEFSHIFIAKDVDGSLVILDGMNEHTFTYDQIKAIHQVLTENDVIELISNSTTLREAYEHSKHMLTPRVQEELDKAKERLKESAEKQEERLKLLIDVGIKSHKSKATVSKVYEHICRNVLGKRKITETLPMAIMVQLSNAIPDAVMRLSDDIF